MAANRADAIGLTIMVDDFKFFTDSHEDSPCNKRLLSLALLEGEADEAVGLVDHEEGNVEHVVV